MATDSDRQNPSVTEVGEWLSERGFGRFRGLFAEQEIDAETLAEVTESDLERWGIPFGPRKHLVRAIRARAAIPAPPASAPASDAERRQVSTMFCDMVGSTALAAQLDPEDMGAVVGAFNVTCRTAIEQLGGRVIRYMGDGVFACFGWPAAHEDDPERAVHAGLAIVRSTKTLKPRPGITIQVRISIATGLVVVGDLIGAGISQEASIVGETPNLAARLQQIARPDTIVISASTRRLLGKLFALRKREPIDLKGIESPVDCWEVLGERVVESRFAASHRIGLSELLGREAELDLLLRRWELARAGKGQIVLLSGEPGIGKSRLAETVCERIRKTPHLRLRYQCSPFRANTPLYPVISQLEREVKIAPSDAAPIRQRKLETLLAAGSVTPEMIPLLADLVCAPTDARSIDDQDSAIRN